MKGKLLSNIVGLCILLGSYQLNAGGNEPTSPPDHEKKPAATRSMPFRGKIDALDKAARTIKVGARQFQVVDTTKILKSGKPSSLEEAATGDEVGGAYREGESGKLELVSLRLGAKPEKEDAPKKVKKNSTP